MLTSETTIASRDTEETQLVAGDQLSGVTARELSNSPRRSRTAAPMRSSSSTAATAAEFGLVGLGQRAGSGKQWRWERDVEDPTPYDNAGVVEIFGTGELAALYATRGAENAFETRRTGDLVLGELTFRRLRGPAQHAEPDHRAAVARGRPHDGRGGKRADPRLRGDKPEPALHGAARRRAGEPRADPAAQPPARREAPLAIMRRSWTWSPAMPGRAWLLSLRSTG